jgi:hypothetical protein
MAINGLGKLPPFQQEIARSLMIHFGDKTFNAARAAGVIGLARASAAAYLSMMVKAGAVHRIRDGVFSMIEPGTVAEEPPKRRAGPKPPAFVDEAPLPAELEPALAPDHMRPFSTIHDAVQWLIERRVSVKPVGVLYLIEERQRVTEEQLIVIVNKRRRKVPHLKQWRSMAAYLPSEIPPPPIEQLRARR